MTFLPIVDRELRESSRRRGTYWLRVRVAFLALLIGVAAYCMSLLQPVNLGQVLFWGLAAVSMLFCLLAGRRSTADCLSQEKRDGTLGLLFLTDLKGHDVVLGKMVATSISGFYALVAILPVLAIPLLAGGMTNGEFWRMVLVLLNTFFFSLAIGIFASAVSRAYRTAMAVNFLLALLLAVAPGALGVGYAIWRNMPGVLRVLPFFYSCPIFSFFACSDAQYATMARDFWWSLAVTDGLAWMLTLLACWIVPRTWGDKPAPAPSRRWRWRDLGRMLNYGSQAGCAAFRQRALDVNAFYWLAGRARLKPGQVWFFLACAAGWWALGRIKMGAYWITEETYFATSIIINSALKLWIALEAGQQLGEDRRAGAFELLLATPLTAGDFLRGQILALRRQFFRPLLLVTALELVLAFLLHHNRILHAQEFFACLAGICILWADVVTLPWVAMVAALTNKSQTQATANTVARIFILPWGAFAGVLACLNLFYEMDLMRWEPGAWFGLWLWFSLGLATDLVFGLCARHTLRKNFRRLAVQSFLPEPPRAPWWRSFWRAVKWTGQWAGRRVPARARKPALACLAVMVAAGAVLWARRSPQHFPPPVLVSITRSNGVFNVFPGGNSGVLFIMPDGTLWRWGKPGAPQSTRAAVPEQIGTAHDWVKAVGAGTHCLGLRADGTIWGWGFSNGRYSPEPQLAVEGNDWIDFGTGLHHAAAIKRDGTLWTWNEPLVANEGLAKPRQLLAVVPQNAAPPFRHGRTKPLTTYGPRTNGKSAARSKFGGGGRYYGRPALPTPFAPTNGTPGARSGLGNGGHHAVTPQFGLIASGMTPGTSSNWAAVYCGVESTFALQKEGTLWAGGNLTRFVNGGSALVLQGNVVTVFPTLLCAATNWTSIDANGLARNRAGEMWDIRNALPNPRAAASAVCTLVSPNWASDRIQSVAAWSRVEVRGDGTLWTTRLQSSAPPVVFAEEWRQLGTRSDWMAVWDQERTGFGLTTDRTVWTWGVELGQEPVKTYESRLELLRARLTGRPQSAASRETPASVAQPRPLLKLVGGQANR